MLRTLSLLLLLVAVTACTTYVPKEPRAPDEYDRAADIIWELTRYETASWKIDVEYRRGSEHKALWMNKNGGGGLAVGYPSLTEANVAARAKCEALIDRRRCFPVMENQILVLDRSNF